MYVRHLIRAPVGIYYFFTIPVLYDIYLNHVKLQYKLYQKTYCHAMEICFLKSFKVLVVEISFGIK